jgi:hypothetical protein
VYPVVLRCTRREEDDRDNTKRRILAQPAAKIESIATRNHNIEQEERGRLSLCIAKYLVDRQIGADSETSAFQVVLDQPGDIGIVFQHKNRLTHFVNLDRTSDIVTVRLA